MLNTWALCALWVRPALVAALLSILPRICTALSEIAAGNLARTDRRV